MLEHGTACQDRIAGRGDIMHANDLGPLQCHRHCHSDRSKLSFVHGASEELLEKSLSRMADADRPSQRPKAADVSEDFKIMIGGLTKPDSGVDYDLSSGNSQPLKRAQARVEKT